jgi:hypothetical protein
MDPDHWNACVDLVCQPIEQLNPVQRTAALVFQYDGEIMNGGHTLHLDRQQGLPDDDLLAALKQIGATAHARLLAEAHFLSRDRIESDENDEDHAAELIEALDRQYGRIKPDINELLENYFIAHPKDFPKQV